jgi:hypothetical protein
MGYIQEENNEAGAARSETARAKGWAPIYNVRNTLPLFG